MPRSAPPAVRVALLEHAAEMLAAREAVSARSLAARVGASTTAVYTHFGGMPGLWSAVRQEGFIRLGDRLSAVSATDDPVDDLAALAAAYTAHGLAHPALYRAMFDAAADLPDPGAADASFGGLVGAASRAQQEGRLTGDAPLDVATRIWAAGHGLLMLALTDVLPRETVDAHGPEMVVAVLTAGGDDPGRCRASVRAGWSRG